MDNTKKLVDTKLDVIMSTGGKRDSWLKPEFTPMPAAAAAAAAAAAGLAD
eukprot:COSAG06_NODE_4374_length_4319_cov_5.169905_4_plen_50_part_00